ncbi:MAG: hypothetical protein ACR2PZ_06110 [Pseudomonadales bacterium]
MQAKAWTSMPYLLFVSALASAPSNAAPVASQAPVDPAFLEFLALVIEEDQELVDLMDMENMPVLGTQEDPATGVPVSAQGELTDE